MCFKKPFLSKIAWSQQIQQSSFSRGLSTRTQTHFRVPEYTAADVSGFTSCCSPTNGNSKWSNSNNWSNSIIRDGQLGYHGGGFQFASTYVNVSDSESISLRFDAFKDAERSYHILNFSASPNNKFGDGKGDFFRSAGFAKKCRFLRCMSSLLSFTFF